MRRPAAFTLVELVVVVLLLSIITSVAIMRMVSRSQSAQDAAVRESLYAVRGAIELYTAAHDGALPGADGSEAGFRTDVQPYLRRQRFPSCPVGAKNDLVKISTGTGPIQGEANPLEAWHYNSQTGEFIINYSAQSQSLGLPYDQL